ncbi:hypothetical protein QQZ08_010927 [Neonectria magnoliae]|uniref:Glycosyltransferase 2-like domain-containing protein n=1 Tax=Neonectria magnoliae TaxID=2732573 RepID=A0ABR1HDH7_9HYPO
MVIMTIEKASTVLAWIAYEPTKPSKDPKRLPSVTIVIPAYNESSFVALAMDSIRRSDYPRRKLQVVAIDDGSTDDTWKHIRTAAAVLEAAGISCLTHRHEYNLGKRTAICTGFRLSRGDIIVSLDSDSILHQRALRHLVAPIMRDARVGGVAGHLTALNVKDRMVPRLLDILFNTGGNIPRAAQSHVGGFVTILPGALSAFRASAVKPLLDGLSETTFLGAQLRHGEDVELTMGLLQADWTTTYQSSAVVYTTVPETLVRTLLINNLWLAAVAHLTDEQRANIDFAQPDQVEILSDLLELVKDAKQRSIDNVWKFNRKSGETFVIRDVLRKVAEWIDRFRTIGDVVVQYDPAHAALPWTGILIEDIKTFDFVFENAFVLAELINHHAIFS